MTIDDCLDHDIDIKVERTKTRPIPRGAITPLRAWQFCILQAFIGLALAFWLLQYKTYVFAAPMSPSIQLNTESHRWCISMLVWPIYVIYPTCKASLSHNISTTVRTKLMWALAVDVLRTHTLGIPVLLSKLSYPLTSSHHLIQGVMFNIGVFMGWSELSEEDIDWRVLAPLYIASILWTVTYETLYQHLVSSLILLMGIPPNSCRRHP